MKKFYLLLPILVMMLPLFASATSGACSDHGGVDCAAGPQPNGNVICNDQWMGSSVSYASMEECSQTSAGGPGCMNLADIYAQYGLPAKLQATDELYTQDTTLYNDCVTQAKTISNLSSQTVAILNCTSDNTSRLSQLDTLQSENATLQAEADAECQAEGAQELEQLQQSQSQTTTLPPVSSPAQPAAAQPVPTIPQPAATQCGFNAHASGTDCICNTGYTQYGGQCYYNPTTVTAPTPTPSPTVAPAPTPTPATVASNLAKLFAPPKLSANSTTSVATSTVSSGSTTSAYPAPSSTTAQPAPKNPGLLSRMYHFFTSFFGLF